MCCVCVLTGIWTGQYDWITRWWIPSLGQELLQHYNLLFLYNFITASSRPTCFNCVIYPPPPPTYLTPIAPPSIILLGCFSLSLHTFIPPNSPGHGATIHLDGAPTLWPPPIVCTYFAWACDCRPLSGWILFAVLYLRPGPCQHQWFYRPRVPSSFWLPPLLSRLILSLPASTGGPVSCRSQGVCVVFLCPLFLVYLPLPTCIMLHLLVSSGV